jgi:hypothetical protein
VQATAEAVLDAANNGDLEALMRLLGEDPALLHCKGGEVRIARTKGTGDGPPIVAVDRRKEAGNTEM